MTDKEANEAIKELRKEVDRQAADEGLWFIAAYITEAYLQKELRKLHSMIEDLSDRLGS